MDDKLYGPYLPEQLSEFIRPETRLCREGTEEWRGAQDFPELSFLWSGVPVELPPSVGWMVRLEGSGAILGPFARGALAEMIQSGEVSGEDMVKHTDWDEWEPVSRTKLVEPPHPSAIPPVDLPSPEGFMKVIREMSDQELLKEHGENYKQYARRERKIMKEELLRRGLIKKPF